MRYFEAEERVHIPTKDILSWTFDDQKYDKDKPIYLDATDLSRSISSRQALTIIRKLVAGLQAVGVAQGDCVCLHAFNDIYYSMLFHGIIGTGAVYTGTNPAYTTHELVHHIRTSGAKFLITEPEMLNNILAAADQCGVERRNIFIFDVLGQKIPCGFHSWTTLLQHGEQDWVRFDNEATSKASTAGRMFSSGTTGLPKATILSHYNFIAQHTLAFEDPSKPYEVRRLHVLPMFHMSAAPVGHVAPLRSAQVTYVMRRFDLEPYLANIEKFKITDAGVVPPLVILIIMSPLAKKYSLKSIRVVLCGAAPLDAGSQARLRELIGSDATVTQVWGMTETSSISTMFRWPEDDTTGSIGRILPNMEAMLIDEEGKNISAYDVRGELCVRGPLVVQGYYGNDRATASSFIHGDWFRTGDIVYCDGQTKKWYIVDRQKELIKVRGFQVAPLEIEGVLLSHPGIADTAVIGVCPAGDDAELPRAYIVRRPGLGDNLVEEDIRRFTSERLAKYKNLDGGIRFVDSIPKNATGKIQKTVLKEQARKEFAAGRSKL